jgi:hypothetical protein
MYDLREKACNEINKKFGFDIKVEKREVEKTDGGIHNNIRGDSGE